MRVLFMSIPGIGHVFPMIPLAWALRSAGHEVAFATTGDALRAQDAGLPVYDVKPGFDFQAVVQQFLKDKDPELIAKMRTVKLRDFRELGQAGQAGHFFGQLLGTLTEEFVHVARSWRPDVIVTSPMLMAGFVAADALDVPVVAHAFGVSAAEHIVDMMRARSADAGGPADFAFPATVHSVEVVPSTLLAEGESNGWRMRYVPYNGGGVTPEWLAEPIDRPRIGVTLGTVAPKMQGLTEVERVLAVAPKVDAEFVLALGDTDLSTLGDLPDNVRTVGWVPLNALLTTCAGVIHHGGAGTMLTAAAAGIPQLILPNGADRYINADAAQAAGAAVSIEDEELESHVVERLFTDEKLVGAAHTLRDDIQAMPAPADLVAKLADLV